MKKYVLPLLISLGIGIVLGALGYCGLTLLGCFYDTSPHKHPIAFPFSVLGCFGCAITLLFLLWRYITLRVKHPCIPMTVVDIMLALALALPSLIAWGELAQLIRLLYKT